MAQNDGTLIVAPIRPFDSADEYPVVEDEYIKGGYRVVADITARDAITEDRRSVGMRVHVISTARDYRLVGGTENSNWFEIGTDGDDTLREDLASTAAGKGAELVGWESSEPNAVSGTVDDKLQRLRLSTDTDPVSSVLAAGAVFLAGEHSTDQKLNIKNDLFGFGGILENTGLEPADGFVDFDVTNGVTLRDVDMTGAGRSTLLNVVGSDVSISGGSFINEATGVSSGRGVLVDSAVDRVSVIGSTLEGEKFGLLSSDSHSGWGFVVGLNFAETINNNPYNFNNPDKTLEGLVCVGNIGRRDSGASATPPALALAIAGTQAAAVVGNVVKYGDQDSFHLEDGHQNVVWLGNVARECRQTGLKSLATGANLEKGEPPVLVANSLKGISGNTSRGFDLPTDATNQQIDGTPVVGNVVVRFGTGFNFGDGFFVAEANTAKDTTLAYRGGQYTKQFGTNVASGATTLAEGGRKAFIGKIVQKTKPTSILTPAAGMVGAGTVLNGFAFEQTINHTGGGTEAFDIFALPNPGYVHGRVTVLFSDSGNNMAYTADILWDGSALTIVNESVSRRGVIGVADTAYLDVSADTLRIRINSSTAINDTRAFVNFDGVYYIRQT